MREPQGISELLRRRVRLVARVESVGLVCGLNGLIQPHPGIVPMSADGFLGDLQDLGRFGVGQANKIVQLYDFGANRVLHGQLLQSLVDQQYFLVIRAGGDLQVVHVQPLLSAAVFGAAFAPGAVHQDVTHRFGRRGKEVAPSVPLLPLGADQPQPGFMHEVG